MFRCITLLFAAVLFSPLGATTLYDGSQNTSLSAQGWQFGSLSAGGAYQEVVMGGSTNMTTTGTIRAGYSYGSPLTLDRTTGYQFTWDLQLTSEAHSSADRAGFSLIVIGGDLKGIEIGFWSNEIWAQNDSPIFTHGEGAAFDTTQRAQYALTILNGTYDFSVNNASLLSGALRNYSAGGVPYTVANFVFIGDDTFSANASARVFGATVSTTPEPGTWTLGAAALAGLMVIRRRK